MPAKSRAVNEQSLQLEIALRNYQNTAYSRFMERDNGGKIEDIEIIYSWKYKLVSKKRDSHRQLLLVCCNCGAKIMALKYAPADWLTFYIISRNLVHTAMHIMVILFSWAFYMYFIPVFCAPMSILVRIVWFVRLSDVNTVGLIAPTLYR